MRFGKPVATFWGRLCRCLVSSLTGIQQAQPSRLGGALLRAALQAIAHPEGHGRRETIQSLANQWFVLWRRETGRCFESIQGSL